jgi:hypothetical protein
MVVNSSAGLSSWSSLFEHGVADEEVYGREEIIA